MIAKLVAILLAIPFAVLLQLCLNRSRKRSTEAVRCSRCKQWRSLHREHPGGPAGAFCCDLAFIVQVDGRLEVYDLGLPDETIAEDCA